VPTRSHHCADPLLVLGWGRAFRTEWEMVMGLIVDLYWSFRCPYSYIVLPRVIELRDKFRVPIDLRIVHPAAIRNPSYFERMDPLARPYFMKDSAPAAAFDGGGVAGGETIPHVDAVKAARIMRYDGAAAVEPVRMDSRHQRRRNRHQ
jgi:2-hydroxychromene-2-carboxylate isomerase